MDQCGKIALGAGTFALAVQSLPSKTKISRMATPIDDEHNTLPIFKLILSMCFRCAGRCSKTICVLFVSDRRWLF